MTHDEMIAVIQAHKEGKELEATPKHTIRWEDCPSFIWSFHTYDYRIKPTPKRVPLGPDDFPPGTVVAFVGKTRRWLMVTEAEPGCIWYASGSDNYMASYRDLLDKFLYRPPGSTEWLPCYKEQS